MTTLITRRTVVVRAAQVQVDNIIPGIDNTEHVVVSVKDARNLVLGKVVRITTRELSNSTGKIIGLDYAVDLRPGDRIHVKA